MKDEDTTREELIGDLEKLRLRIAELEALEAERKQVEEAVLHSQQLLAKTFSSLNDAIFIVDADNVEIMECNPAASVIFGYTREEMIGRKTGFLHVDGSTLEEFRAHLYPAVEEKGFLFLSEFRMKRKDGEIFFTELTVRPLENESGARIGWVSVVADITDRKQAEEVLRESEERFQEMAENIREVFWLFDCIEQRVIYVSPAYEEIWGR